LYNSSKNLEVNLAYVDMHMREIKYVNFTDNHQLTRLESSLVQIGGKEIIYNQNENSGGTLKGLLRRLGVPFDSKDMNIIGKDNFGNLDYMLHDSSSSLEHLTSSHPTCLTAIQALFNFLRIFDQESDQKCYKISEFDDSKYCSISVDARLCLGIFSESNVNSTKSAKSSNKLSNHFENFLTKRHFVKKSGAGVFGDSETSTVSNKKETSLFDVLDQTTTKSGQRMLFDWVQTPLNDVNLIMSRQNIVQLFIENPNILSQLVNILKGNFPDLARTALRIQKSNPRFILKYLYEAKIALTSVPGLLGIFKEINEEMAADDENSPENQKNHQRFNRKIHHTLIPTKR